VTDICTIEPLLVRDSDGIEAAIAGIVKKSMDKLKAAIAKQRFIFVERTRAFLDMLFLFIDNTYYD